MDQIKERCTYCGSDVYYTGTETLIKCGMCGHTLVVAKFENELAKMTAALEEGEQARLELAEAEKARQDAEVRLRDAIGHLGEISEGQDVLSRLMQSLLAGQDTSNEKLTSLQQISERILKGQGDLFEGMNILGDIKDRLQNIGMDAKAAQDYAKDFITWFQNIHEDDRARLKDIDDRSSILLAEQKAANDKIDRLTDSAQKTQAALEAFHGQYTKDKLEEIGELFHQAENFRHDRIYDQAEKYYRQVITKSGADAEIYWRLLLCHYCVSYQHSDAGDGELIPIILNPDLTSPEDMSLRKDLDAQLKILPSEQRTVYEIELSKIDRILDKYRMIRGSVSYDVFISVKQQRDGIPTKDSFAAVTLYNTLTEKGLKVFNSRLTPPPAGQEYEPYIISALMSAKAMIVVGTCKENMEAQWVKNEWSRFQWLQRNEKKLTGKTERILLCYLAEGMTAEDIPRGLNPSLQAIKADITADKQLDQALGFLITESSQADHYHDDAKQAANQMTTWLYLGQFDKVLEKYQALTREGLYLDQAQIHISALCAEKKVTGLDELIHSDTDLSAEKLFKLALGFSTGEDDKALLQNASEENRSWRRAHENEADRLLQKGKEAAAVGSVIKAFQLYEKAAEQGNPEAQYILSQCYEYGKGAETDKGKAFQWLMKAAEQGNARAQHELGVRYAIGQDVPLDEEEAFRWYEKSAFQGDVLGQIDLAGSYEYGSGTKKDMDKAIYWYEKAVKSYDPDMPAAHLEIVNAADKLGFFYEFGIGVPRDIDQAIYWYSIADELGDERAAGFADILKTIKTQQSKKQKNALSAEEWYEKGRYARQQSDYDRSIEYFMKAADLGLVHALWGVGDIYELKGEDENAVLWFQKAAEQGDVKAQSALGYYYLKGYGVEINPELAISWTQKAAEAGDPEAQFTLGLCYERGECVPEDRKKAEYWFIKAAKQGDALGRQYHLAEFYEKSGNMINAFYWYRKAAGADNEAAMERIGLCYQHGTGVIRDEHEAVRWYVKAGTKKAQYYLAKCYFDGTGVEKDEIQAMYWLREAARRGDEQAQKELDELEKTSADPEHVHRTPDGKILDSWEEIIENIDNKTCQEKYRIGDAKELDLGSEGIIEMQLVGFDEDELADGSGKAPTTWIARQLLKSAHRMNPPAEKTGFIIKKVVPGTGVAGGWEMSEMRSYLEKTIRSYIPKAVNERLRKVNKLASGKKTADTLWIPSVYEVYGVDKYAYKMNASDPGGLEIHLDEKGAGYHKFAESISSDVKKENGFIYWILSKRDANESTLNEKGAGYHKFIESTSSAVNKEEDESSEWYLRTSAHGFCFVTGTGELRNAADENQTPRGICVGFCL